MAIQMLENVAPSSSTSATTGMGPRKRQRVSSPEPLVRKGSNDIPGSGSNNNVNNTTVATELCVDSCKNKNTSVEFIPKKSIRPAWICTDLSEERVLFLVTHHTNWNPFLLCLLSCVCKKTAAISDRVLWREFCLSRAPKMVSDLLLGSKNGHIDGGWQALGKLFLYCAGCCDSSKSPNFPKRNVRGHFVRTTRFSRTSGRCFLIPQCRTDTLYVSDPCEHANGPEDVGLFRGVFRGFDNSETKRLLTIKRVQLEEEEKCPFCKARGWSMDAAQMIPKSASARLAAYNQNVEYFICLNGHLNGKCSLLPLSDSDASDEDN